MWDSSQIGSLTNEIANAASGVLLQDAEMITLLQGQFVFLVFACGMIAFLAYRLGRKA